MRNKIRNLVAFAIVALITPVACGQENLPDDVGQLVDRWDAQSASVATMKLKCRHLVMTPDYPYPDPNAKPVDPAEWNRQNREAIKVSLTRGQLEEFYRNTLVKLLDSEDWASAAERETARFLASVDAKIDYWWEDLSIVDDGHSLRNETRLEDGVVYMRVRSGNSELQFSSEDKQATITDQLTQVRMYSHQDLRFVPKLKLRELDAQPQLEMLEGGARLTVGLTQFDFDPKTATVSHWVPRLSAEEPPPVEIWQDLPQKYAGDVVFPRISIHAKYTSVEGSVEPRLAYVDIYLIETAEFNSEISSEEFKIAAPRGTVIVNLTEQRKSISSIPAVKANRDLDDITTQTYPPIHTTPEAIIGKKSRYIRPLMVANLVTLVLGIVYWFFRKPRLRS